MDLNAKLLLAVVVTMLLAACADSAGPASRVGQSSPETYCRPQYPPAALKAQAQGVSIVAFHLDQGGKVIGTEIVKSSGQTPAHRLLDEETVRALSLCPFHPKLDDQGHPVAGVVQVTYTWRLE